MQATKYAENITKTTGGFAAFGEQKEREKLGLVESFNLSTELTDLTERSDSQILAYEDEVTAREDIVKQMFPEQEAAPATYWETVKQLGGGIAKLATGEDISRPVQRQSIPRLLRMYDQGVGRVPKATAKFLEDGKLRIQGNEDGTITFVGRPGDAYWEQYAKDNQGSLQAWHTLTTEVFSKYPELSDEQIRGRVIARINEQRMKLTKKLEAADTSTTGTFAGTLWSVSTDPVNLAIMALTMPIGGATGFGFWGNAGRAAMREGVIGMGTETSIQFGAVADFHRDLGDDYGLNEQLLNIGFATVGGALFGSAGSSLYDANIIRKASGNRIEAFTRWDRLQGFKTQPDIQKHFDLMEIADSQQMEWKTIDLGMDMAPTKTTVVDNLIYVDYGEGTLMGRVTAETDTTITVETLGLDGKYKNKIFDRETGNEVGGKGTAHATDPVTNPLEESLAVDDEGRIPVVEPTEDPIISGEAMPEPKNPIAQKDRIEIDAEYKVEMDELADLETELGLAPKEDGIMPVKKEGELDAEGQKAATKERAQEDLDTYRKASPKRSDPGSDNKGDGGGWTHTPGGRVSGVLRLDTYAPSPKTKALLEANNKTPLTFEGHTNAKQFHEDITAAKEADDYGSAVYVYDEAEYANMKLFTTPDGQAGFALKDGDIVSVFKHPDSDIKGALDSIMPLAKEQGGVKLDAFDTMLTGAYRKYGFNTKAKMPFSEEFAPEGWDPKQYKEYNEGKPDVDYMVLDPEGDGKKPIRTEDYDKAVAAQTAEVQRLWPDLSTKEKVDMMPSLAPETVGALYGFEEDENGNWTYNVTKGILGAAGGRFARKAISSKGLKNAILKYLNESEEAAMKAAGGGTPPEVDLVARVTKELEGAGNKQKNMIIGKAMREATPEEKEILIDMMKKAAPAKEVKPKSEKAAVQINIREEFNERFYSKLDHEIDQMPDDITFKNKDEVIKYLEEKGVSKAELEGAGIARTFNEVGSIKKNELESAMKYREDKIYKKTTNPEDSEPEPLSYDDWESENVEVGSWEQAPNYLDSESGMGLKVYDQYTDNESWITEKWHEGSYVDEDGIEYDWEGLGKDWLTEHGDQNYVDEALEAMREGSLDVDASGWLDQQLAKARTTENVELEARMKELEKVNEGFDQYLEDAMTDKELKEAIFNQDAGDDINEWRIEQARDNGDVYDYYNNKTYYEDEHGRTFDTEEDAVEGVKELMHDDYVERLEDPYGDNDRLWGEYTVPGGEDYRVSVYQMDDFVARIGNTAKEPHWGDLEGGADNIQVHARMKDRVDAADKKGTVLEEIQSQWEQDWRGEGGGAKPPSAAQVADAQAKKVEIGTKVDDLVKEQEMARQAKEGFKKEASDIRMKFNDNKDTVVLGKMYEEADRLENASEALRKEALADRELRGVWDDDKRKAYNAAVEVRNDYMDSIDKYNTAYKEEPGYKKLIGDIAIEQAKENRLREEKEIVAGKLRGVEAILNPKQPSIATPPLQKRSTYERLALVDNLMEAADNGQDYFGWINASIQNGSKTPESTYTGMRNAMNLESPGIIKTWTGETPYKAYYDPADDPGGAKQYWNYKKAEEDGFNTKPGEIDDTPWYWRIDIDDAMREKLKKMDVPIYSILLGVGLATAEGDNDGI